MRLYEIRFFNGLVKRAWSYSIEGALESLGYSRRALVTIVTGWELLGVAL